MSTGSRPGGDASRLVYSTDGGRVRATPHNRKVAPPAPAPPPGVPDDGIVRIQRDKKGRGGKTATTITGLPGDESALDLLLKQLKSRLGTGGSREGRVLVIQGDHRDRLLAEVTALGYRAKLAGG